MGPDVPGNGVVLSERLPQSSPRTANNSKAKPRAKAELVQSQPFTRRVWNRPTLNIDSVAPTYSPNTTGAARTNFF